MNTRPLGARGIKLNMDLLRAAVLPDLFRLAGSPLDAELFTIEPCVLITTDDAESYVLTTEGVGIRAEKAGGVTLHLIWGWQAVYLEVDFEQVQKAITTETVDLADWIRVFGSRLDSNHYIWWSRMQNQLVPAGNIQLAAKSPCYCDSAYHPAGH